MNSMPPPRPNSSITVGRETLAPRLRRGIDLLTERGVRVSGGSRIRRCLALAEKLPQLDRPDPELRARLTAFVDGAALADIFDELQHLNPSAADFDTLTGGAFDLDAPKDRARAKQLELWAAAICTRRGLRVQLAEPDLLVDVEGTTFAIAAKRPQSVTGLRDRLVEGIRQIRATPYPGFLLVDLTRVWNLHREVIVVSDNHSVDDAFTSRAGELARLRLPERWLHKADRERTVQGIISVAFGVVLDTTKVEYVSGQWVRCEPLHPDGDRKHPLFRALMTRNVMQP